ncbi:MauE/DoxX family redox-associated membrane protein [uncultured Salegentibacter sp.]|uniref:MauE/DoxX family redox-associated membrane protein n=1 Tax=uncultured Salegentibacter sp. TaxID=259320 RepID=UPI0030DB3C93|tara:strand:+ start:4269 stop:4706 length:438 start_codon:yes stop_codon:yes gene_type:complete
MEARKKIQEFIRYAFIILLFYAAVTKFIEYPQFYNDLLNSPVFGNEKMAVFISWFIPIIELATAGILLSPKYRNVGMYLASGLILLFTIYIIWILEFSENIPCSCGGIINNLSWQEHLIFNACFLLLGLLGIYLQVKNQRKVYIK